MEISKLNSILPTEDGRKSAVILCSQNKILKTVTYKEVIEYADKIREFMMKNVNVKPICIGLLMEKNVFIPSIILSFQDLGFSFVFLAKQTLIKTVQNLNIKWILSYEYDSIADSFTMEDMLQFSMNEELKLWRNDNNSVNVKPVCFKDVFCAVQTSGSTGENKTVRIPHSCIERNVLSLNKHFGLSNVDVVYWGTPLTFDPTLVEFLLGVFCRATLLIVPNLVSLNQNFLYDALFKIGRASFLQIVPSVFLRWSKEQIAGILGDSCLTTLAFGGEPFPEAVLEFDRQAQLAVFNLYGVTELSCWATVWTIPSDLPDENQVVLGEALDDTFVELRNHDVPVQSGIGEICIGSNTRYCLLNDSEANMSFPFVVKTGDLGEFTEHGLVFKGRKTRSIKRFGHKINLQNIEEAIFREINLTSRLVYSTQHKKLLAFILIEEYFNKNTKIRLLDKLRVKLLKSIPESEFPDFVDVVAQFPLSEHGKICDRSLEKRYENSVSNFVKQKHSSKEVFVTILNRYLKTDISNHLETLGKHTFFELGGNSILAMQLLSEFKDCTGNDTLGELVTLILTESIQSCISYVQDNVTLKRKLSEAAVCEEPSKKLVLDSKESDGVVWTYDLKGCVDASPLVFEKSNETYIAAGSFAHIFAVLKETGEEYLKLTLPQEVEAKPCVSTCGNFIYIGCSNGTMYCIDLSLKYFVWEFPTQEKVSSAACLCRKSAAIVFGSYDSCVYCLTAQDGVLLWKTKLLGSIRADPLCSRTFIYVGTTKGMCYALNEGDGSVNWTYKLEGPVFGSPCLINESVIWPCVTGLLYGTALTGGLKWTQNINGNIFSSLTVYENKIYFGCHDSRVYELTVSDDAARISNNFQLESEISSTPLVYRYEDKVLIFCVCNIGTLCAIDVNSRKNTFRYRLSAQSFSSPCIFKNVLYVGCRDNNLYCIDIKKAIS